MTLDPTEEPLGPVIRDKRRIDPQTGQLRQPPPAAASTEAAEATVQPDQAAAAVGEADGRFEIAAALAERTADLQRLQAEYVNYKRRVDRDRELVRQSAVGSVLMSLLPVLDDIWRAREHDELTGGFKAVAESLERTVAGLGLDSFGAVGEPFDPRIHEALMHSYSDEVDGPVCQAVLQVGYRHGDRVLRPARVAVAEPTAETEETVSAETSTSAESTSAESSAAAETVQEPSENS